MAKGRFIVIDGVDGSGKATQSKLFVERARGSGLRVAEIAFPRYGTPAGDAVDAYLHDKYGVLGPYEASWLFAADRLAARAQLREWLDAGMLVVADRYVASNMGHQGGKILDAAERAEFFRWVEEQEYGRLALPRPDINLILHMPAETSQALARARRASLDAHEADLAHLKRAEATYLEIAATFPGFTLIECMQGGALMSREDIHEAVWSALAPHIAMAALPS